MASLYSKFLDFIGIEETDEEEDEREDYYRDRDDRYDDYRRNDRSDRNDRNDRGGRSGRDDYYSRSERSSREDRDPYYQDDRDIRDDEDNVVNFRRGQGTSARQSAARQSQPRRERPAPQQTNGANLPISGGMKMIVYHPVSYEDTQIIIDNLKNRKPVIVNMEELDVDCAQRILDFLSGAVYALAGTMCKISRGIFVVAPNNYDVVGNNDDFGDSM